MAKSERPQSRRAALLEFAILGVLHDGALHGYELRKRLTTALGIFRALSYGSLYPALRSLVESGHISETPEPTASGKRPRITYQLTAEGKEHFQDLVAASGPDAWDDDDFDVRLAFFSRTEREVRLRILEGRRSRLEERLARVREVSARNRERMDAYTLALQQHGEERAEREVRWLEELIRAERRAALDPGPAAYDLDVLPPTRTTPPQNKE
ncbi:PadR family transcriptional regulator [Intrasporangium calvum]|uniref:PadR family transcriptional regulator n=1 Tax=Intrasporangium calvum TaxID=53358 RepID=A0ABT5GDG7_9MICO|nr:PadR family transcriptional regulator [Intrasporangium calvum]MDC5696107.1 PadR family transcriptional regulator [Intrasporangium calvum]